MRARANAAAAVATALLALSAIPGCLVSSHNSTRVNGAYVDNADLAAVAIHRSTMDDVERRLGPPTCRDCAEDGVEVWSWEATERRSGHGGVLFLVSASDTRVVDRTVHVKFIDGVAVEKWRD
ncbi:MAG: hypothetical protein CMJ31_05570 [Phycisphaerae bacterium]|nr:hypothetical protein [Phycisphaerae bacterium]